MRFLSFCIAFFLMVGSHAAAQNVTNHVIFGSGNTNGSFTIDQSAGVELGLRAKLRHDAMGQPQNTFNFNGIDTYTFQAGVAPTQASPTATWSFEWSINSSYDGMGSFLNAYTYALSMTSPTGAFITAFDPINGANPSTSTVFWDHAIGTNATTAGPSGGRQIATDAATYGTLIGANNLAQNSWKPHWFAANFNPTLLGDYVFTLTAFDNTNAQVASTSMTVSAVPEPTALMMVGSVIGLVGLRRRRRK